MRLTLFVAVTAAFCIGSARFLEQDENDEPKEQMCSEPESMYIHYRVHQENEYREKFPVGTRLTYRCGSGYVPRDIKTWHATCRTRNDGSVDWDIGEHDCRPVSCGHPGDVRWGRLLDAVFVFPRHVRYQCNKGYRMIGDANLYCQSDGTWNKAKPECQIVDCGPLDDIADGAVRLFGTEYGSKAEFTCNEGFKLTGTSTRTCDADGQWSDESPRCEEIWCPPPEPPEGNGTTSLGPNPENQRSGIRLKYKCPEKTVLQGSDINICHETGSWLFDRPTCIRNCVVQADPSAAVLRPSNWSNKMAEVKPGTEVTVLDSNLYVKCKEGYEFIDTNFRHNPQPRSLRCQDGAWYPPSPWCKEKPCRDLYVKGGQPELLEVAHNEVVNFTCKQHYQLQRAHSLPDPVCRFGKVQGTLPSCEPVGCRFEDLLNRVTGGRPRQGQDVSHGSFAAYECETPLELENPEGLRCDFGTWTGLQPPKCVPPKQCIVPYDTGSKVMKKSWINMHWFQRELNPGTIVRKGDSNLSVTCEDGYHFREKYLRGRSEIELYCYGSHWSHPTPWCTKIHPNEAPGTCKLPQRENRFKAHNDHRRIVVGDSVPHGTQLIFHCEPVGEVVLVGARTSRCHNGQWLPELPYCYGRESKYWNDISMHFVTENYTVPGGDVYVEPYSDVVLECRSNEPVIILLNTTDKADIRYMWSPGQYTAIARFRLRSNERTVIACEKIRNRRFFRSINVLGYSLYRCPQIPTEPNRFWREKSRGVIQFHCQKGYIRQGKSTVHCLGQGLWSDPFPTCELPTETSSVRTTQYKYDDPAKQMEPAPAVPESDVNGCPPIPTVQHLVKKQISRGSYEFYCQEGYRLQGKSLIHCLVDGVWSDHFPACVPHTETWSVPAATSENGDAANKMESTAPAVQGNHVAKCTLPRNSSGMFYRKDERENFVKIDQDKTFDHESVLYIFCRERGRFVWWQCRRGEWSAERLCEGSSESAPAGTTHHSQEQGKATKPGEITNGPVDGSAVHTVNGNEAPERKGDERHNAGYVTVTPAQHSHGFTTTEVPYMRPSNGFNNTRVAAVHEASNSHQLTRGHMRNVSVSTESVPMIQQKGETTARPVLALTSPNEPSRSAICTHPTASGSCSDPVDRRRQTLKGTGVGPVDTAAGVHHELRTTAPESRKESATDAYSNANSSFSTSYSKQSADLPQQKANPKVPSQFDAFEALTDRTSTNSSADVSADPVRPEGSSVPSSIAAPNGCQVEQFFKFAPRGLVIAFYSAVVPSNSKFGASCDGDGYTLVGNSSAIACLHNGSWAIPPQLKCIEACADFDTGPNGPTVVGRKGFYELGDSVTLSCANGTQLQPRVERITCLGYRWSEPVVPICVPVEEKPKPKNQVNKKRGPSG